MVRFVSASGLCARGRLCRSVRQALAIASAPVLTAGGLALPSAVAVASGTGVTAAVAVSSVAAAPAARAVTSGNGKALVLLQNGESTAPETTALQAAGWTVDQETPATWKSGSWTWNGSTTTFSAFAVLVIGDPSTTSSCSNLTPTTTTLGTAWQAAVSGNVAVVGTAPAAAGTSAANALVTDSVAYAGSGSGPGLYMSLNCEYTAVAANTAVPLLNGVEGIGAAGGVTVQGGLLCSDPGVVNKWEADAAGTFTGFTSSSLGTSSWASGCPVQEAFNSWPAMFTPVAYDAASDVTANFTASDGVAGQPYVLLGAPVSTAAATTAQGVTTGGFVPALAVRAGGNPVTPGVVHGTAGDGVDTENGDFSESSTDVSIRGFGPALDFTRTYDALAARQQQEAGAPGPLGYGWTDNWATYEVHGRPMPGDIYTVNAVGCSLNSPHDIASDAAGDLFVADEGRSRVVEIPATSKNQFGYAMTAGNCYTVAGSPTGSTGNSGNGHAATSALMNGPLSMAVDAAGDLFISDSGNNQVREVPASTGTQWGQSMTQGDIYTIAGSTAGTAGHTGDGGPATSALISDPGQIRLDKTGNVYFADLGNSRVQEVAFATGSQRGQSMTAADIYTVAGSSVGTIGAPVDGTLATSAELDSVGGIAVDATGNIYISDSWFNVVSMVAGHTETAWGRSLAGNHIYTVAGNSANTGATGTASGDGGPAVGAGLKEPGGVATDPAGDLLIADTGNNRIQEIPVASGVQWGQPMTARDVYTILGQASGTAGTSGDGGPAAAAFLDLPNSVNIDPDGDLLVPDTANSKLREVFNSTTQLFSTTPAGTGTTFVQADGSRVDFQPKLSTGLCPADWMVYPGSALCTSPVNIGAGIQQDPTTHVYIYKQQPGVTYDYTSAGVLMDVRDAAGDTETVTAASPAPGSGNCPAAAASCQTITAPVGTGGTARLLVIGSNSAGLVTSLTDPMGRRWTYAYNAASQLTSATDPMGHATSYTYGAGATGNPQLASDLLTITSPNAQPGGPDAGKAMVNVYDSSGRVTSQTDPMGYATTFNYCVSAAVGNCLNPETGSGLVTVSVPDSNSIVYEYTQGTQAARTTMTGAIVTSETDEQPDITTGTLLDTSSTDGNNHITSNTTDSLGNITKTVAPTGTTTSSYAEQNQGTEKLANCATMAAATSTCQSGSPPGPVSPGATITPPSSTPPVGTTYTQYDAYGNELYMTTGVYEPGASGAAYTRTTYQLFNGNSVTLPGTSAPVTCAEVAPTASLPCADIDADGVVTQLAYDKAGDLTASSTPDGNGSEVATTTYTYDGDGEQTSVTSPDGNLPGANVGDYTTTSSYNADGEKTSDTQAGGSGATVTPRTMNYGYDGNSNQTTVQDARGYTTTTTYDPDGRSTLVTDPDGNAALTCYDPEGRQAQTVPPVGVAAGNLTPASCPSSYPSGYGTRLAADATTYTYNEDGQKTAMSTPAPAGQAGAQTTTYSYDGNGDLTQTTAPPASNGGPNQVTTDVYDSSDQLVSETTGYGTSAAATVSYCYDPSGNRTSVIYPDGNVSGVAQCETSAPWVVNPGTYPTQAAYQTTSSYDSVSELVSTTAPATTAAPSGATTGFSYDPAGNLLSHTDPSGMTSTWTYSPLDKPASITYSGSSAHSVTSSYDASGAVTGRTDASGTSSYAYDPFGELTSATNGAGQTIGYGYDADKNTTSVTYPLPATASWAATSTVTYGYDHASQLTAVTDFSGNAVSISNTADGKPSSATLGTTGDTVTTTYDSAGGPSAVSLKTSTATLQSFTYSEAPAGNILTETDSPASSQSPATYTYDSKARIASMTPGTGSALSYGFDPSGNLTTPPAGGTATYDKAGELTSSALSGTTTNYTYNAVGQRLTAAQGSTAVASGTWNGAAELTAYSDSLANMATAAYDGSGLRTSATMTPSGHSATTQQYVWGTWGAIPELIMDSKNAYLYGNGLTPVEQVDLSTGGITYLAADSLGSVRGIVNSSGILSGTTGYDAWGNPLNSGGLTAATPFGFAGGYTDPTGLIYLLNRYYDPTVGQFLSIDPEVKTTLQPYAYTQGNPVSQTDPTGLISARGVVNWANANYSGGDNGYVDDCTDFASRALHLGGGDPQTWPAPKTSQNVINDRKNDWYWYYGWVGVAKGAMIAASYSWGGAFNLADHENMRGAWFTRHRQDARPGDIVSANMYGSSWSGIDHTGVVVAMQNGWPYLAQHSGDKEESLSVWVQKDANCHYWIWRPANG